MFSIINTIENKTDEIVNKYLQKKQQISGEALKKEVFEIDQKLHEIELIIHKYCEETTNGKDMGHCKNEIFNEWINNHAGSFREFLNSCKMLSYLKDFLTEYERSKNNLKVIEENENIDTFIKDYFNKNIKWLESFFLAGI